MIYDKELKERLGLDNDKPIPANFNVPYFVHEEDSFRLERITKRLTIACVIETIVLLLVIILL